MKRPWFINIVGRSGSGKTTLVEKIISHYTGKGLKVCAIKSMRHDFEIDYPGKDSHRYREAGAATSIITNREMYGVVSRHHGMKTPFDLAREQCGDADVVIVEGFREGDSLKIEVIGNSKETPLFQSGISNVRVLVSDNDIDSDLPVFRRNDISGIITYLEILKQA